VRLLRSVGGLKYLIFYLRKMEKVRTFALEKTKKVFLLTNKSKHYGNY